MGCTKEKYSELPGAQAFAQKIQVENHSFYVSLEEYLVILPTIQYHMDEPLPNPSALPLYFLAQGTSKQVKVVLSGEGVDELFGGYGCYQECLAYEGYQKRVPLWVRRILAETAAKLPSFHGRCFLVRGALPMSERYIRNNYVFHYRERHKVLRQVDTAKPLTSTPNSYLRRLRTKRHHQNAVCRPSSLAHLRYPSKSR